MITIAHESNRLPATARGLGGVGLGIPVLHCHTYVTSGKKLEDVNTTLQDPLIHDGLAHGICVLASNCDKPMYVKLVEALCAEHQIDLIKVDDNKKLDEWVGLCKTDREGKPHKVVGCSCVIVKDCGKDSQAKDVIEEYFKYKK